MGPHRLGVFLILAALTACSDLQQPDSKPAAMATKPDTASLITAADATRNDGRLSEAIAIYQQVLVADHESVDAQYGIAECLLGTGRAGDAKPIFRALEGKEKFHALALQGVGIADLALDKREEAAKALQDAIEADPKLWRAYNGLGLIADWKRQPKVAMELYHKALTINPASAVLLNNLGYSRLLAGKPDEAITNFHKALDLDPNSETIQNNLRLAVAAKGDYAGATRNVPRDKQAVVMNNVGFVAMRRGDLAVAERLLSRAMEADPHYDDTIAKNLDQLNALKAAAR